MAKIKVRHRGNIVGTLEVLDHVRMPVEERGLPSLTMIVLTMMRSNSFLYMPSRGDFRLVIEGEELLLDVTNPRLGSGDLSLLVGFESDNPDYQPDEAMLEVSREVADANGLKGKTFGPRLGMEAKELFERMDDERQRAGIAKE